VIIIERPPNFEAIRAMFPKSENEGVIFAYAGNIYNPSGAVIPPALIAHEDVHLKRQSELFTPDSWWDLYLCDPEFRYHEELLAHAAEFKMQKGARDRNLGARLMISTALRLIAPLYNYVPPVSLQRAMKDLKREIGK
jgi:hypothetical protein